MKAVCPSDETLFKVLKSRHPVPSSSRLARHLESCAVCSERLDAMTRWDSESTLPDEAWERVDRERSGSLPRLPSDSIDGYTLVEQIAEGAQGVVYRATDARGNDREFAIKVCRPSGPKARKRFEHEARVLARVRHTGVPKLHDHGVLVHMGEHLPYMVMDFVRGVPVTEHARAKQLKPRECLRLIAGFCEPLRTVHASGIVHRDIKPSNLLVDESGKPVLIDFGVVQDHGSEGSPSSLTTRRQIIGTVAYMSPEQARSDHDSVSPSSDIFSLGVVLYELLANRHPFAEVGTPPMQVLRRIEDCEVPDINEAATWTGWPVGMGNLIARAMARDAEERFRSAEEFRLALLETARAEDEPRSVPGRRRQVSASTAPLSRARLGAASFMLGAFVVLLIWQWLG